LGASVAPENSFLQLPPHIIIYIVKLCYIARMFSKLKLVKNKPSQYNEKEMLLKNALDVLDTLLSNKLSHLDIKNYHYDASIAVEELGIDEELVMQLLDDYVAQTIKSILQFEEHMLILKGSRSKDQSMDYTPFRELAHKNLGVARNLRIKDAEILLYELMKKDDLEYLITCLEALKACSIRLSPECAYNTLKLIEVKNSLLKNY